jgi:transposase
MRGRQLLVNWHDDQKTLFNVYKEEKDPEIRSRLHALWLLRSGKMVKEVTALLGVHYRTVQRWVGWYRIGGLAEVRRHHRGEGGGAPKFLTPEQEKILFTYASEKGFKTIRHAQQWILKQFGVKYTFWGTRSLLIRLKYKKKVPRPFSPKADPKQQKEWKKRGLQTL